MKRKKAVVAKAEIRINAYDIIAEAVEAGVMYGWHRSRKHDANPSEDSIIDEICNAVMNEISSRVQFGPFGDAD